MIDFLLGNNDAIQVTVSQGQRNGKYKNTELRAITLTF